MSQYTIIITDDIDQTRINIKQKREDVNKKSSNYLETEKNTIQLMPPKAGALREYDADVVINETEYENLTHLPTKPDAVTVNLQ